MSRTSRPPSWIGADIEEQAFSAQFDEIRRLELREGTAQSQSAFTAQLADVRYVEWRGSRSNEQDDDMYWLAHPQRGDSDNVQGLDSEERPPIEQEMTLNDREKARAVYKHNVENYWSLFQQASTMPRNGFIGLRQNRSQHQLRCTSCLGMIPARPQEYFIPWEPPEPDGFVYNIHLNPCFTKLYLEVELIAEAEKDSDGKSPSKTSISFIKANRDHWQAGRDELKAKTLHISPEVKTRKDEDEDEKPDDRTTCLNCCDSVRNGDKFRYAALSSDPWKRKWPRRFMLHSWCVSEGYFGSGSGPTTSPGTSKPSDRDDCLEPQSE